MSQISQKSISGITSITTPAGIDNQFTLHTNDTSQAAKLDAAGNFHFSNHVNTTGITSASNFKTGSSDLHSSGLTVGNTLVHSTGVNASSMDIDDFVDVGNNIKLGNAGVITATSFVGDGSDLTNLPAGLGTALSATASSPLNKMYYTNQVLGVPSSVTVDVPASASKAYTQYADIKVESSADLIIAEGDDLIPDVLGLADFGTFGGGASAGRIRVNSISNAANDGSPTVQKGLVVTGVCTATSFSGDGSALTGLSGVSVANQADNRLITATGTTDALNGEAGLTYNGLQLNISNTVPELFLTDTNSNNSYGRVRGNGGNLILSADVNNATGGSVMVFEMDGAEKARIDTNGGVGIGTDNFSSKLNNEVGLAIHGSANDNCRISFTTPTKSNPGSLIGYYGLNRFGIDTYDGIEFRDVTRSYATIFKIDQNGYMTNNQPYAYFRFNAHSDTGSLQKQTNVNTVTVQNGMAHDGSGRFTIPVTGKYLIGSDNNVLDNSDHYCAVYINGSNQDGFRYQNTATNQSGNVNIWKSSSRTCILTLSANDYIEIYVKGAQDNAAWNQHFIYLIG